jgi:hypothetical protein
MNPLAAISDGDFRHFTNPIFLLPPLPSVR